MNHLVSELLSSLHDRQHVMVSQLYEFCEINSGSDNLLGLAAMHAKLRSAFSPIADTIETYDLPPIPTYDLSGSSVLQKTGHALFIRKRPALKRRILLCGHMDTVYGEHNPFQQMTPITDNHLNGPGVADMKGGLVVMLHALTAFEQSPYANQLGWDILINADEEIGSPASSTLLTKIAPNYQAGFVYEPAMSIEGTFAKNRKGSGKLTLIATGKAAHVGRAFNEGRNAICFLAEIITAINALNGKRNGVTLNIGKISGGEALNVVPDKAVAMIDIRINQSEDERWVTDQINQIANQLQREGLSLSIHGRFGRPVKRINAATELLFDRTKHVGHLLQLPIHWQDCGGCCDGNNLAESGLPVIDTLGVRGGDIHSPHEFVLLDSLVERAALSALLMIDLAKDEPRE